jgi:hypothetical protein
MCIVIEPDRRTRSPGKSTKDAARPFGGVTSTTGAAGTSICIAEELGWIAEELVTLDPRATNELLVVPVLDADGNDELSDG